MLRVRIELTTSAFHMMSSHTVYKYGALTDCATGAFTKTCLHSLSESYMNIFERKKPRVRIELTISAFLKMSSHTIYKYGALTGCATGAFTESGLHSLSESYKEYFSERKMFRLRIELTTSAFLMTSSLTVYKYGILADCATGAFTKHCLHSLSESYKEYFWKENAPGEDRTHNLRMLSHTVYKYGSLTDCATGEFTRHCLHSLSE
ncbi:unnamed protein product [Acanthosepion pharaonis]|uniref:Uncharacterized protein n=1 Tax=Acanthosepion pharaonis TaxID=158019 RepID=A0A812DQQ9_ACAPH|nr:unnamed protein product [Sepia pharaonis]